MLAAMMPSLLAAVGPCDIYGAASTPCVAAHSTVRALYSAYAGPLYELMRSDNATLNITVMGAGGLANAKAQTDFCPPKFSCTIERIFDQSPFANHLLKVVVQKGNKFGWPTTGINAMRDALSVGGHGVYSAYFEGGQNAGVGTIGFRTAGKNGTAVDDQPESMYMVTSGKHYNQGCEPRSGPNPELGSLLLACR